jgi:hypothetical protein
VGLEQRRGQESPQLVLTEGSEKGLSVLAAKGLSVQSDMAGNVQPRTEKGSEKREVLNHNSQ